MEMTEERLTELDDRPIEIIQSEQLIEKIETERINRVSGLCGIVTKFLPFISSEFQKERKKNERLKIYLKE